MKNFSLLFSLFLISACNRFDDEVFYKKCAKVVEHSVQDELRDAAKYYIRTGIYVRDAGNKKSDLIVYKTAQDFYKAFSALQNKIRLSEDVKDQETYVISFLDSIYAMHEFRPEHLKDRRAQIKTIYSSKMEEELKKNLLLEQLTLIEKEILKLQVDQVGYCDSFFFSTYPIIAWEKDTVTEGDSLRGKVFLYDHNDKNINKLINQIEINKVPVQSDTYNNCKFTIAPPASVVFDSKGESLQYWEGKVMYTDLRTLKDSVLVVKGKYIIEKNIK